MKILVIGSGGREHALGWKLAESAQRPELYFAPGNPGVEGLGQRLDIEPSDTQGLVLFAQREKMDLTVIGPEQPLSDGLADALREEGLAVFGPTKAGAQIETSKVYAKELMESAGIPTAAYRYCEDMRTAQSALREFDAPYVVKEDGLAAGKGVTIARNTQEAEAALAAAFNKDMPVVVEEFLSGEELSILAICDGRRAIPLVSAQDFKKAGEGNTGPNTGGMGAYAPVPFVTPALRQTIQNQVLDPVMRTFQAESIDYRGVLYAGLMIGQSGFGRPGTVKVIEFNARFGDPETQVILPLLEEDLADILLAAAHGDLSAYAEKGFRFTPGKSAVTVVLTSQGYPGTYNIGVPITLPETLPDNTVLFHAATRRQPDGSVVTAGGRVVNATGIGPGIAEARAGAYRLAETITYQTRFFRKDIAQEVSALV